MKSLSTKQGRTILYVSHNMNTIRQLCDRCIVLDKGKVIFNGDVEESIKIYLGKNNDEFYTEMDLSKRERPTNVTGDVKMTTFKLTDKDNLVFHNNEQLRFSIDWYSKEALENVKFKLIIRNSSDVPVGITLTEPISHIDKNTYLKSNLSFDISQLSPEKYYASISIFQNDSVGNDLLLDHITRAISFEVIDNSVNDTLVWQSKYWGNIKFDNLKATTEVL
jgi:lipopolysaccharide transport system ATP-binding protein